MSDPPFLPMPLGPHLASRQHYRNISQSPTRQRHTAEDALVRLTPGAALEAFRSPSGDLKECMDAATASEQLFAVEAAIAARSIQEWLDELSSWPWPSEGGSVGFQPPLAKQRKVSESDGGREEMEEGYMGSLTAAEVVLYERRVDEIARDLDGLDLEEIKRQVLHNHILPLSRPGTPMSGSRRSGATGLSFNKMDDLTALLTATVLQALPNLSRLSRLMDTWKSRLIVLRKVPSMVASLVDAEVAIQSAWNAIEARGNDQSSNSTSGDGQRKGRSAVSQNDFDIMKRVVEKKVSKAARDLDYMLDTLDGREDTIPDDWVDRMDKAEHIYSTWVAVCEQRIREAGWARAAQQLQPMQASSRNVVERATGGQTEAEHAPATSPSDAARRTSTSIAESGKPEQDLRDAMGNTSSKAHAMSTDLPRPKVQSLDGSPATGASGEASPSSGTDSDQGTSAISRSTQKIAGDGHIQPPQDDFDIISDFAPYSPGGSDEDESFLPEQPSSGRRAWSMASTATTVIHEPASDNLPHLQPALEVSRVQDAQVLPSDDTSPPSSPPDFRASTRSATSVSFNDIPTVAELDESPPHTPLDTSFMDESEFSQDGFTPSRRLSVGSADLHLQQQISEILESIPAKIKLSSVPPINLNPPDLQIPRLKPRPDPLPRSYSSLSSRSGTPSFLLAPARHTRARNQRGGNQEIKLYHLSRSTGEAPIKLFIRCVGENGERVMVRVGGGWADLGEYLKEYASHHSRRSVAGNAAQVEVRGLPQLDFGRSGSSPPSRPGSAMDSPMTPLSIRKTRKSIGEESAKMPRLPNTPFAGTPLAGPAITTETPASDFSARSRSSSRLSWTEEDSSLGMAGPKAKNVEMTEESRAWVESVKEKVRTFSGDRRSSEQHAPTPAERRFGELDRVGGTKRVFRRGL